MALIQDGNNQNPQQPKDSSIQKGGLPQWEANVKKVIVIGEPRCGKTRFIRQYYDHHSKGDIYSHNGVEVYPCELEGLNQQRKAAIFEIPGDPEFLLEHRQPHYEEADILVFMYAIDDPTSLQKLNQKWIPECIHIIVYHEIPVLIVANKIDLQDDPTVIERLALENKSPVTLEQGKEVLYKFSVARHIEECSANDLNQVEDVFLIIKDLVLMPE